ncbi:MAG: hypothetical protein Q9184_003366 [Pyrenodesmia sp. 2 TL-2023]
MDIYPVKRRKVENDSTTMNGRTLYTSNSMDKSSAVPIPSTEYRPNGSTTLAPKQSRTSWSTMTTLSNGSHHSNLFKLQLDELLKKISSKYETRYVAAEGLMNKLREIIENIPDRESLIASDAYKALEDSSGIRIPFAKPRAEPGSKLLLAYAKPTNITVVGSFARRTALFLDSKVTIDMAVIMPLRLFQPKDYRDYRYFQKRAYYLACLADGIQKARIPYLAISFALQDDNPLQPILILEPAKDNQCDQPGRSNYRIRILLAAPSDLFPVDKTLPTKGCIRTSVADGPKEAPSPMYNAVLRPIQVSSTNLKLGRIDRPVFFDGSRGLNLLFKMSTWSYKMLRHEATSSLKTLNDPLMDHFKALFIRRVDEPSARFDYMLRISLNQHNGVSFSTGSLRDETIHLVDELYEKITYGLGDRATLICPQVPSVDAWQIASSPPSSHTPLHLTIGLLLNPQKSQRTVDRGPPVKEKEASSIFREFWGQRAELRRFTDGTIMESVVWNQSDSKQALLDIILGHILRRHFGIHELNDIGMFGKAFDYVLPQRIGTQTDALVLFSATRSTFETLCKSIRDLEGLPLQIRQLSAASPELRFCSVFAPAVDQPHNPVRPIDFQVQFEGSTRWPQDLVTVQRTKIAFLLKIAEGLEGGGSILAAAVGLGGEKQKLPEDPFLDIATADGVVFRLRIYHEHEIKLLEHALHSRTSLLGSKEELALALSSHKRTYIQGPAHTQAVYALSTQFPLLSHTVRLLKKWRDAHLLSSHIRDELIELLAIGTFVHPSPWQAPGSLNSAFVRTLASVASWNWQSDPLIVDFNFELNKQDIESIHADFKAWRTIDPHMNHVAMFAASSIDRGGITWTDHRPAKVIASRFTKLAGAASEIIKEKGLSLQPESLFVPSLHEYDFIIYLKDEFGIGTLKKSSFKNLHIQSTRDPLDAIFNPAQQFVGELEELHGDNVVFFHNRSAMTVIAGVWKPHTGPRDWKVDLDYNTMPVLGDGGAQPPVTINKAAVLHGIARLGGNMIAKIDQKS